MTAVLWIMSGREYEYANMNQVNFSTLDELILSLAAWYQDTSSAYPPGLVRAMNSLALAMGAGFPRTFTAFLQLCRTPLGEWYPFPLEANMKRWALLQGAHLSESALDLMFQLPKEVIEQAARRGFVPQSVLDNQRFALFIDEMRNLADRAEAQHLYDTIRSFLISHSWITRDELRALRASGIDAERIEWVKEALYEPDDGDDIYVCERCGILRRHNGRLVGVKPIFCDDHYLDASHIQHLVTGTRTRLKIGIHQRTFIPGQAEKVLFEAAEALHDEFRDHLTRVERYPGLDSYDLRLVFRDEVWAVDVKDLSNADDLAQAIQPLNDSGDLHHDHAFYVVPDRRLSFAPDYLEEANRCRRGQHPEIVLLTQSTFIQKMRTKCADLVRATR